MYIARTQGHSSVVTDTFAASDMKVLAAATAITVVAI